jgi:hypothetical protein
MIHLLRYKAREHGRHDNSGFALAAQPGESKRRPITNTNSRLIVHNGLPALGAPGASIPDGHTICQDHQDPSRINGAGIFIPVTNAFESLNAKLRPAVKTRGHFQNDDAATKLLLLVLRHAAKAWKMQPREWVAAKSQFAIIRR